MIRFAKEKDKDELLNLCITSLPMKEKHFLIYYFKELFSNGKILISELDNKLISQIHMQDHKLYHRGKYLDVSFMLGITTHYDYRKRGIMRDLIEMSIDDCSKKHLFTFMEASNPKMFERYGFEAISFRKRYIVYGKELMRYNTNGVNENISVEELVSLYKQFSNRFDCFFKRDEEYYQHFINLAKEKEAKICIYRNEEGIAQGYAIYYELDEGIEIKEIIYLDTRTLKKLLKYAIGYNPFISIEVSQAERLEKIFKLSIPRTFPCVMARVNNIKLYNKLYNCNCKNIKDIIGQSNKPILLNEKY